MEMDPRTLPDLAVIPLVHADTTPGARAVEDLLYGVEFTAAA